MSAGHHNPSVWFVTTLLITLAPMSVAQEVAPTSPAEIGRQIAVLKSDASPFERAMACRRLTVIGDKSAVPALSGLLADEQLATYARSALEAIPDSEAETALLEAAESLQGQLLIGVLNSLGKRGSAGSIDGLRTHLTTADPGVHAAAVKALARIGNAQSAEILVQDLQQPALPQRSATAHACLDCAARLLREGQQERAIIIYRAVRRAELPLHIVLAATGREIMGSGEEGVTLLSEQLSASDEQRFRCGLQAARELGAAATGPLLTQLKQQDEVRQELLLMALGDIGDAKALEPVIELAQQGPNNVRVQAIYALEKLDNPAAVPALLTASVSPQPVVAQAARTALSALQGDQIDAAIVAMLTATDPNAVRAAIEMAGLRKITSATTELFRLATEADAEMQESAIAALGATVQQADLERLVSLALQIEVPSVQRAAFEALRTACARLPQEWCAERLTAALNGAPPAAQVTLLEQLAGVGGIRALATVSEAAASADDAMRDLGTRLLGDWMTPDAAPVLRKLCEMWPPGKYRTRALRGYIRIARQLEMTPDERVAVCGMALELADRDAERLLVLEVLQRFPTPEGLALAAAQLKSDQLRRGAMLAIVSMADTVAPLAPKNTEEILQQVIDVCDDATIALQAQQQLSIARDFVRQMQEETQFVPLCDGSTLQGWIGGGSVFRVEQGAIVGGSLERALGVGNDFLCSERTYRDFELRLQFRLRGENANGGVNIRSRRDPDSGVAVGYQADLGQSYWGCLYDEARRNRVLAQATQTPPLRENDWNDYRIRCEGGRIQLWINGVQTVDYTESEADIPQDGIIALQVQANRPTEARYRQIRIREL